VLHLDKVFKNINFTEQEFPKGEYDNCTFIDCIFTAVDMANMSFLECTFDTCDLSNAMIKTTIFNTITFYKCKLVGLNFSVCNPFLFSITVEEGSLQFASFYNLAMKHSQFTNVNLQSVDFTQADASQSVFNNCDLKAAIFEHTNLTKADFTTAKNYSIDPEQNILKNAKFSRNGLSGLLTKHKIIIRD